ncbi:MAG: tRNA 2-thiouridine(34) synthase MnmA [Gemmatimonadetes bacterium]|nr:tRNA 2-thiouridine(34) synthase MnmA [Gemmatimonadota bacterium]
MSSTVLVALSGGVDSSVAVAAMVEAGHRVIAVTMRTFCYAEEAATESARSCCGLEGIADARAVARTFGVPHHVLDLADLFKARVVDDFVSEYSAGRTPNPCIRCNTLVKFPALLERFRALGVEALATGHHARIERGAGGGVRLRRGADRAKDQSYVLWGLPNEILGRIHLPIGEMTKAEVRARARELALVTAEKPESQEICFVPDGDHGSFVGERHPDALRPGPIVNPAGERIGTHRGIARYTVGQRKGIGIASSEPLYVRAIDASTGRITVDREEGLRVDRCWIDEINVLADLPRNTWINGVLAQFRVHQDPRPVRVRLEGERSARIELSSPIVGIAPGQSAVIYRGEDLLLGGVIERASLLASGPAA